MYLRIVTTFIIDINSFINREVFPVLRKYDMTDLMSLAREDMTFYVAFLPLYKFIAKFAALNFRNQSFKTDNLQAVSLQKIFCCLFIICLLSNSENSQKALIQFISNQYSPFIARG